MHPLDSYFMRVKAMIPARFKLRLRRVLGMTNQYIGNFPDWESASKQSTGYNAADILERVRKATLQVKQGHAEFERDTILFHSPQANQRLLSLLLRAATANQGSLHVVDFGGALGSIYWQHRRFLSTIPKLRWSVIEQESFVTCGNREIKDETLDFHSNLDNCLTAGRPDLILLSSSLQYIPTPWLVLQSASKAQIPYIFIDRTPLLQGMNERICIQRVPSCIYKASYPIRLLSRDRLLDAIGPTYRLMEEWTCKEDDSMVSFQGLRLERAAP